MLKLIVLLFLGITLTLAHDGCIHDKLDVPLQHINDHQAETPDQVRMLQESGYQSIRIYADYTYLTNVTNTIRDYIQNQLMPSAISYYQATLTLNRSTSNIIYAGQCGGFAAPNWLATVGVAADLVILVNAGRSDGASSLGWALPCALSATNDRPLVGMISFNLAYLLTADTVSLESNLITTLHEITHILGFSSNLYSFYKNSNGSTYNPIGSKTVNGQYVQYIKAEPVLTRVRDYFGCNTTEGAYLENEGRSGRAGSHFERRVFFNEFMTATDITDSVISQFTLAVLESTGWYNVSYSMVEPFTWGKGKGCSFLDGPCLANSDTSNFADEFCAPLARQGCTYTGRAVAVCGANALYNDSTIPEEFNYFGDYTVVLDYFSDNCPYYLGYPDLDCENPDNKANALLYDETYGLNSRCFAGTLTTENTPRARTGFCFSTKCTTVNGKPKIKVNVGKYTITCSQVGTVTLGDYNGVFECPDPTTFCERSNPVYCERGCSGRGTCNDGVCTCPIGWGGADCGLRVYADGCARCKWEALATSCFGDSCACNPDSGLCTGLPAVGVGNT